MPLNIARTWHFGVNLRMSDLSQPEEVRDIFKEILISADDQIPIRGLQSSFSYGIPEDGFTQISYGIPEDGITQISRFPQISADCT
jgi:hypothetical protein